MTGEIDHTDESDGSDANRRTDGVFGFVAGLSAAALVAPAIAIWVALRVSADPAVLYFVLLGTVVAVTTSVGLVARREWLAVRLGASKWGWSAMVVPFVYYAGLFVAGLVRGDAPPGPVAGIAVVGAVAGLLVGAGLVAASHNRHAEAALADADELAHFTAPAPERDRRVATRAMVGLVAAGVLGIVGSVALDYPPFRWLFQWVVPVAAGLYGSTSPREVGVSDAGLVVGNPVYRRFRPWSAYESYAVSEEAIVVRRAGWSPRGLRDLRRDATEVKDSGEVAAALGEFLPQR
jgi:hypothetical protein